MSVPVAASPDQKGVQPPMTTADRGCSDPKKAAMLAGDALDLLGSFDGKPDLIATDPPYAFGGSGDEHALSATVAIVLREAAQRLAKGRWMLVMCAASWRSTAYMVESVRGVVDPIRIGTWCKPLARTKVKPGGWQWASVNVIAFRKGKAIDKTECLMRDYINAAPIINGRRAELPSLVADWMVTPYAVPGGLMLDPFAGSGALIEAAERAGMTAVGFEKRPPVEAEGFAAITEQLRRPSAAEPPQIPQP